MAGAFRRVFQVLFSVFFVFLLGFWATKGNRVYLPRDWPLCKMAIPLDCRVAVWAVYLQSCWSYLLEWETYFTACCYWKRTVGENQRTFSFSILNHDRDNMYWWYKFFLERSSILSDYWLCLQLANGSKWDTSIEAIYICWSSSYQSEDSGNWQNVAGVLFCAG